MTNDQFRETLGKLGLTQVEAAHLLGLDIGTVNRWACGRTAVAEPAARMLTLMLKRRLRAAEVLAWLKLPAFPA